jgi:hypothetical protein
VAWASEEHRRTVVIRDLILTNETMMKINVRDECETMDSTASRPTMELLGMSTNEKWGRR